VQQRQFVFLSQDENRRVVFILRSRVSASSKILYYRQDAGIFIP
jgi:hypothetical protein